MHLQALALTHTLHTFTRTSEVRARCPASGTMVAGSGSARRARTSKRSAGDLEHSSNRQHDVDDVVQTNRAERVESSQLRELCENARLVCINGKSECHISKSGKD